MRKQGEERKMTQNKRQDKMRQGNEMRQKGSSI